MSAAMQQKPDLQTVRLVGVVAYADSLFEKRSLEGGEPKFGMTLVILPNEAPGATEMLERASMAAASAKFGTDRSKWGRLRGIHKDAIIKNPEDFPKMGTFPKGTIFIRASSKDEIGFADAHGSEMSLEEAKRMVTSGWRVKAQVRVAGFTHNTGNGIACYVNGIQIIRKVMDLGGRQSVQGMFGALSDEELNEEV